VSVTQSKSNRIFDLILPLWFVTHFAVALAMFRGDWNFESVLDRLTIPFPVVLARTPLDGLLWLGLLAILRIVIRRGAIKAEGSHRNAFVAVLLWAVVVGTASRSISIPEMSLVFRQSWPDAQRAVGVLDLDNSLWLSVILPLSFCRAGFEGEWSPSCVRSAPRIDAIAAQAAAFCVAVAVGLLVTSVVSGSDSWWKAMSAGCWISKSSVVYLWTAAFEEVLYRGVMLGALRWLLLGRTRPSRVNAFTGIAITAVFALAHWRNGWPSMVFATAVGAAGAVSVLRYRSLSAAIVGHWVADMVVSPWLC
jgi:hypothetical protein